MGKKTGSAPSSPIQPSAMATESLAHLKEEGNTLFAKKEYNRALDCYERALKLVPGDHPDAALLHSNKAACHMMHKKFKEAVNECSAALEVQPAFFKALVRRAKAYEQLGQLKQALADMQRANRLDSATVETRDAEKRLKDLVGGKRPAGMGNGLAAAGLGRKAAAVPSKAPASGRQLTFPAKLTMGDDTRIIQLVPGVSYMELMEHVRQLYPAATPFVLKFLDKEGDLVTIAHRNDLQRAMHEAVEQASKTARGGAVTQQNLPPIRLQVVKVASEEEVPRIPESEVQYFQQIMSQVAKQQQLQQAAAAANREGRTLTPDDLRAAAGEGEAAAPQVQVDEWILAFVELLKDHCGIDPDKPLEVQEVGHDRLQSAFTSMMNEDGKADELLDQAMDKFEDQVCYGMSNQATVHQYRAEFLMFKAAKEGKPGSSIAAEAEKQWAAAEKKLEEALAYKASFIDGYVAKANITQARAKLAADYLVKPVKPADEIKDAKERQAAEEAASKAAVQEAFGRVSKESAAAAEPLMEAVYGLYRTALEAMPEEEKAKEIKPMKPTAEQDPNDPDGGMSVKANLLIMWGNALYEHSHLRAAGGREDWKALVEAAAAKFREAGAHPVDIRNALKGHPLAEQLEDLIGPEPEPVAAEAAGSPAAAAAEEAPKGLPSLGPKPKKKAEA